MLSLAIASLRIIETEERPFSRKHLACSRLIVITRRQSPDEGLMGSADYSTRRFTWHNPVLDGVCEVNLQCKKRDKHATEWKGMTTPYY
jgi:hypothetical protein